MTVEAEIPATTQERARRLVEASGGLLRDEIALAAAVAEADGHAVVPPGLWTAGLLVTLTGRAEGTGREARLQTDQGEVLVRGVADEAMGQAATYHLLEATGPHRARVTSWTVTVPHPGAEGGVAGCIVTVGPTRTVRRRDGGVSFTAAATLETAAGAVTVNAWDGVLKRLLELGAGASVRLTEVYERSYQGRPELHTARGCEVEATVAAPASR